MAKLFWVLCVLGMWAVANGATPSHAPSPSVDCSSVLLSMADCLTFVMNGSTVSKPEGSCCSGFKSVLKENPKCLCESFNNNNNLGIPLNMTKASTLPSACSVSAPHLSKCGFPSPSPSEAPLVAVSPSSNPTPTGASAETVAPTPSQSAAAVVYTPVAILVASLAVVACLYF